jgi:hypothetical protein
MARNKTITDMLTLRYIPLSHARTWEQNPKRHDIGAIAQSIAQYGFLDPPKFDAKLNDGQGGLVEGNGRTEALLWMQGQGQELPRGIAIDPDSGEWQVPVLFGVDAESQSAAQAYAVDHNNLVLSGGNFTAVDMMGLWDEAEYTRILSSLAHEAVSPISVDGSDLNLLAQLQTPPRIASLMAGDNGGGAAAADDDFWPYIRAQVSPDVYRRWNLFLQTLEGETDNERLSNLLDRAGI